MSSTLLVPVHTSSQILVGQLGRDGLQGFTAKPHGCTHLHVEMMEMPRMGLNEPKHHGSIVSVAEERI